MGIPVRIEVFEGPLDLLLHLIDKSKLNIYDIPIAEITDQYLTYIHTMEIGKLDVMSEFIEMAAILINIKSKMLLPEEPKEDKEELDPRQVLVDRLIEYKKFKLMAQQFRGYQADANKIFYKDASIPDEVALFVPEMDPMTFMGDLDINRLFAVFQSVMKKKVDKIDPIRSKFGDIQKETYSVDDKIKYITLLGMQYKKMVFRQLLDAQSGRTEVVVTFLAILELMKTGLIKIVQESIFDEIQIKFIGSEEHGNFEN